VKHNAIIAVVAIAALACSKKKDDALTIPVEAVTRQTILVDAQATGVVEPINVIEVKAKSSGQVVAMPVETGTLLKTGDLIVQLDTRDTRNAYAQAKADVDAANIKLQVSRRARDRASELFKERIITSGENEAAQVDYANSQATVLRNRASLDLRAQSLEEATVRAPVGGTVIEKTVSLGQVIASGTGSFGGGTTILKMADLTKVRVRALVNETDIGKVRPGLPATVMVDAFPDRPFMGTVEKIEPQATVQQSVTMFPVLISIDNTQGLLMPGMNGEVSVQVERRENVLAVSNDAVRSMNEVVSVATLLGLNPDSVRAQLQATRGNRGGGGARNSAAANGSDNTPAGNGGQAGVAAVPVSERGRNEEGQQGARFQMPDVTDKQCADVKTALAKRPELQTKAAELRGKVQAGELDRQGMQAEMQKAYTAAGLNPAIVRACNFRERGGRGGGNSGVRRGDNDVDRGQRANGESGRPGSASTQPSQGGVSGSTEGGGMAGGGGEMGRGRGGGRTAMVFTVKDGKYTPRVVRLGVSNFDHAEVLSGVVEGENVAILNVAVMQARQANELEQMRGRTAMPGMQRQQPGGQGGGGAGGRQGGRGSAGAGGGQRGGGF